MESINDSLKGKGSLGNSKVIVMVIQELLFSVAESIFDHNYRP